MEGHVAEEDGLGAFAEVALFGEHGVEVADGFAAHAVLKGVAAGGGFAFGGAGSRGVAPGLMGADAGCGFAPLLLCPASGGHQGFLPELSFRLPGFGVFLARLVAMVCRTVRFPKDERVWRVAVRSSFVMGI